MQPSALGNLGSHHSDVQVSTDRPRATGAGPARGLSGKVPHFPPMSSEAILPLSPFADEGTEAQGHQSRPGDLNQVS